MRLHVSAGILLPLLLCACGSSAGNESGEAAAPNASVTVPVNGDNRSAEAGGNSPTQRQGEGREAQGAGVTLAVSPEQTTEDSTVTLTLRNGSKQQVGYNLCTSSLQMANGRDVPTRRVCTMEIRTLEPDRTDTYRYELPVNMAEGSYRFVAQVERMPSGGMVSVQSNSFTVRSD